MRWWPFGQTETRSSDGSGYEGAILGAFESQAGATPRAQATAALEATSSLIARCLASATVEGPAHLAAAVTPAVLAQAGRSLVRLGEQVFEINVDAGAVRLLTAGHHDVYGGADPRSWTYRTSVYGPSGTTTRHLPAAGVVHCRYLTDPVRPYCGVAPLAAAHLAGKLSAETLSALADSESGPRGNLLPLPGVDGDDDSIRELKNDLRNLRGRLAFVESVNSMNPGAPSSAPKGDWEIKRVGADPPAGEVELLGRAFTEVVSACGCPAVLFSETGDGTARREGFRFFLHATLAPIADLIAVELSEKLEGAINLNLDRLFASDLSGRARAFGSMVKAGMNTDKAASLAGLMEAEE